MADRVGITEHGSAATKKMYRFHPVTMRMLDQDESTDEDDEQTFDGTVMENGRLISTFIQYSNVRDFLSREECVHLRAISVPTDHQDIWLNFNDDIDGCVVELKNFGAIKMPLRYLSLMPKDRGDIRHLKDKLKKHIDLTRYSRCELRNFDRSLGFNLFREEGWECWVGLIPRAEHGIVEYDKDVISDLSFQNFINFRNGFKEEIWKYANDGTILGTIMKNDMNNPSRMTILPDDTPYITEALERALSKMQMKSFRPIMFCWRYGEKLQNGLSLRHFDNQAVDCTIHLAVDISCDLDEVDLLWSVDGIQQIIGSRGTLGTCLSFKDAGNYQSNLDGRPLDVHQSLRNVVDTPEIRFIQLYADTPHKRPTGRFHPVSGSIIAGMCLHSMTAKALYRDACAYLTQIDTNSRCLIKSSCRLEFVVHTVMPSEHIYPKDFLNYEGLSYLLDQHAMLIPLPNKVIRIVSQIESFIHQQLRDYFHRFQGKGNISATWTAYQYELAIEKILWGHPLCWRSNTYSVNLGPGVIGSSRSLTDSRGFIALDLPSSAISSEDSIPPLAIWTQSPKVAKAIKRASGLHDHIGASFSVIGRYLILALLQDLYETGKVCISLQFETFLTELQNPETRIQIVGSMIKHSLCESLIVKRRTDSNMVFPKLCQLITNANLDLFEITKCGLEELNLLYFPAVKLQDSNRNPVIVWSYRDSYWLLMGNTNKVDTGKEDETYSQLIKGDLEKRGLVFVSKLKTTPKILPWVRPSLRRLKGEKLSVENTVTTLSLVSCIALLMGGWYIEFQNLPKLLAEVPLTSKRLQELEIFSAWVLDNFKFHGIQLFKLHFTIPIKLSADGKHVKKGESQKVTEHFVVQEEEDALEHIPQINDVNPTVEENIEKRMTICQPIHAGKYIRWSAEEMDIINEVKKMAVAVQSEEAYHAYKAKCMSQNVPFRTLRAFQNKIQRLQ